MTSDGQFKRKRQCCLLTAIIIVYLGCMPTVHSDQPSKASDLYDQRKYKAAGKIWKKLGGSSSENGYSHYRLAELYKEGLGFERHHGQAAYWYRLSAEKGYLPAMHDLGVLHYRGGDETVKNIRAAELWWSKAADRGHVQSQLELVELYLSDRDKNLELALKYARAAASKDSSAGFLLLKEIDKQISLLSVAGASKLLSMSADHYTLFIASFIDFNSAWTFLVKNSIGNAQIHRSVYGEYDVTLGGYANIEDAYAGIVSLPKDLLLLRPRPRRLEVIHHELEPQLDNLDEAWVRQRDPSNYTVELYRANADIDVYDLVTEAGLSNSAVYRSILADSVLIAGVFSSLEEASQVILRLPESLSQLQPRVRQFSQVHSEMKGRRVTAYKGFDVSPKSLTRSGAVVSGQVKQTEPPAKTASSFPKVSDDESKSTSNTSDVNLKLFSAADKWLFGAPESAYSLQVATVRQRSHLQQLASDAEKKYENQPVYVFDQKDPEYYYFYVGLFSNWRAAKLAISELSVDDAVVRNIADTRARRCASWSKREDGEGRFNKYCLSETQL